MSVKKISFGIIGGGKAGKNLALAIQTSSIGQALVFCTRHKKTAKEAAQSCRVPNWTTDYHTILSDKAIDAVVVASPDEFHCQHTIMAAEAKKQVLCEKPMCRSLKEADLMINAARENDVILMIGFSERFNHPCIEAKKRIDQGEIGTPRKIGRASCRERV